MGREPRPLLVGFLHRQHSELIQNNSWKLSELSDPGMRTVSVVKDLTMKQRLGKKELLREAARKNCDRNQEELERNIAYKVVGRRGSKREILAPLRFGENIDEEGEVVWDREDTGATGGRRMARGEEGGCNLPKLLTGGETRRRDSLGSDSGYSTATSGGSGLEHTPRQGRRERAWCRGKQRTNKHSEGRERRGQRPISRKDWGGSGRR